MIQHRPICIALHPDGRVTVNGEAAPAGGLCLTHGYGLGLCRGPDEEMQLPAWGCASQMQISERRVTILTDHSGGYPLYRATRADGCVLLGTDAWQVADGAGLCRLNAAACFDLLSFEFVPGMETLIEGLTELEPATRFLFSYSGDSWTEGAESAWQIEAGSRNGRVSVDEAFENFEAVTAPLKDLAAPGAAGRGKLMVNLSGGWDSRAILAGAVRLQLPGLVACSYGNPEYSGIRVAGQVAAAAGVAHQVFPFEGGDFLKDNFAALCELMPPTSRFNLADGALAMGRAFYKESRGAVCGHSGDGYSGLPEYVLKARLAEPADLTALLDRQMRSSFRHGLYREVLSPAGSGGFQQTSRRLAEGVEALFAEGPTGYFRWKSVNRVRRAAAVELRMLDRFTPVVFMPLLERKFINFWTRLPAELLADQRLYRRMLKERVFTGDLRRLGEIPRESGGRLDPEAPFAGLAESARTNWYRVLRRVNPAAAAKATAADPTALWWQEDEGLRRWAWAELEGSGFVAENFRLDGLRRLVLAPRPADPSFARIGVWCLLTVAGVEKRVG